jgi:RNA binding exosome subunit
MFYCSMELVNAVDLRVFILPEDNPDDVRKAFLEFFPFSLAEEKIPLEEQRATGFNERKITILKATLLKKSHIRAFLKSLLAKLTPDQKAYLLSQKHSRLDEQLKFFIRIDKPTLLNEKRHFITEKGECFHITLSIASYPRSRDKALKAVEQLLTVGPEQ